MQEPRTIVITGASRGLGAALAERYAEAGRRLAIAARGSESLERVAEHCRSLGAEVMTAEVDVRNPQQVEAWLRAIDAVTPIDLLIANAGIFAGNGANKTMESNIDIARVIETNVLGTLYAANVVAGLMRSRRSGQIALVSSLAAVQPLADAPAYSASKAAIASYGEALRDYLLEYGVAVSVILPGHIDTAQTRCHVGPLPGIVSAEAAAARIVDGLRGQQATIAFPLSSNVLVRLGRLLPWRMRERSNRPFRFHVAGEGGETRP